MINLEFNHIDRQIAGWMERHGLLALRLSLAVIFIWFGALKLAGVSAAQELVEATVAWMPLLSPSQWVSVIGWWEVAIGLSFLYRKTLRLAIALLALQLVGTFLPLILLTEITFQQEHFPFAPTIAGQYIIKNLLIIAAALVIGGTVRDSAAKK